MTTLLTSISLLAQFAPANVAPALFAQGSLAKTGAGWGIVLLCVVLALVVVCRPSHRKLTEKKQGGGQRK